jgi:hypothetical protein
MYGDGIEGNLQVGSNIGGNFTDEKKFLLETTSGNKKEKEKDEEKKDEFDLWVDKKIDEEELRRLNKKKSLEKMRYIVKKSFMEVEEEKRKSHRGYRSDPNIVSSESEKLSGFDIDNKKRSKSDSSLERSDSSLKRKDTVDRYLFNLKIDPKDPLKGSGFKKYKTNIDLPPVPSKEWEVDSIDDINQSALMKKRKKREKESLEKMK